jgi:glucose-1-phosphate thymidylyltransferase
MKGILLAGGTGSRLWPLTKAVSKQLLPVYDKPLIYYPLASLMQAQIREVVIVTTSHDQDLFKRLLGDGAKLGMDFKYVVQEAPLGIAHAIKISSEYILNEQVCLILGDNLFHGDSFHRSLKDLNQISGAKVFAYAVKDPERYGVIDFDQHGTAISIEEKPLVPMSKYAVPGIYFYDKEILEIVNELQPSARGELEITAVNQTYLNMKKLSVEIIDRGTAWLDTGTFESLQDASAYIRALEERQGLQIACLEEIAYQNGWITKSDIQAMIDESPKSSLSEYLMKIL